MVRPDNDRDGIFDDMDVDDDNDGIYDSIELSCESNRFIEDFGQEIIPPHRTLIMITLQKA